MAGGDAPRRNSRPSGAHSDTPEGKAAVSASPGRSGRPSGDGTAATPNVPVPDAESGAASGRDASKAPFRRKPMTRLSGAGSGAAVAFAQRRRRAAPIADPVREEVAALAQEVRTLKYSRLELDAALRQAAQAQAQAAALASALEQIRASTSWKLTAPLRSAVSAARALRRFSLKRGAVRHWPAGLVRSVMRAYGGLPLPPAVRDFVRNVAGRLAPGAYKFVMRNVGSPEVLPGQGPNRNDPLWLYDIVNETPLRAGVWRLQQDIAAHVQARGRISHVIALPFLAYGGAEQTALNFAGVVVKSGASVLLLGVDRTLDGPALPQPPQGVLVVDFTDYFPSADFYTREALLLAVLRMAGPEVFHNINSEVAWRLIIKVGARVRRICRVFGSIFAFQYDWRTGERIGYAETYLRDSLSHLDGILSDNKRFIEGAIEVYGLQAERKKFHALYNPSRVDVGDRDPAYLDDLERSLSAGSRPQVLWAGRLDAEKRPDLLMEIVQNCPHFDFHVYGAGVVDSSFVAVDQSLPNITFHGPYSGPREVIKGRTYHAFVFTSRWEGMPNTLLEFGALGLPVVAATVGGVGELIDSDTGYPVPERPMAEDYVAALEQIRAAPSEAVKRARALMDRIAFRHSRDAFARSVHATPGYMAAQPQGSDSLRGRP